MKSTRFDLDKDLPWNSSWLYDMWRKSKLTQPLPHHCQQLPHDAAAYATSWIWVECFRSFQVDPLFLFTLTLSRAESDGRLNIRRIQDLQTCWDISSTDRVLQTRKNMHPRILFVQGGMKSHCLLRAPAFDPDSQFEKSLSCSSEADGSIVQSCFPLLPSDCGSENWKSAKLVRGASQLVKYILSPRDPKDLNLKKWQGQWRIQHVLRGGIQHCHGKAEHAAGTGLQTMTRVEKNACFRRLVNIQKS